jgi:two-component system OmpR family sensor kinase
MLYVAQRGSERREARLNALAVTAGAALAVGLLCALWLRRRVRSELEPVYAMSMAVKRFDPLHPDTTLAGATRQELVPVHDAIRDLGARLSSRLASERAFSAHAAHALRTPLAGMVAQLAVAQRKSPPEAQPALARSRQAADRLQRVVAALLTLFRTGADVKWQSVWLHELSACVPPGDCAIETDGPDPIQADPDLLAAALMNLVDNAVRHGATRIVISARRDAEGASVCVLDNGAGMDETRRVALQAAVGAQAYEGQMGLGLMLADLVARAHGGRLTLLESAIGGRVELRLGLPPQESLQRLPA